MRTVHANTDPIHDLARELGQKLAFARATSQLGLLVSKSVS